jgi:hypothetical protein
MCLRYLYLVFLSLSHTTPTLVCLNCTPRSTWMMSFRVALHHTASHAAYRLSTAFFCLHTTARSHPARPYIIPLSSPLHLPLLHRAVATASSASTSLFVSTSLSHCQTRHAHVRARRRHKPAAVARLSSSCPSSTGHPCPTLYPPTPFQKPKRTLHVRSVPRCETCPSHQPWCLLLLFRQPVFQLSQLH